MDGEHTAERVSHTWKPAADRCAHLLRELPSSRHRLAQETSDVELIQACNIEVQMLVWDLSCGVKSASGTNFANRRVLLKSRKLMS